MSRDAGTTVTATLAERRAEAERLAADLPPLLVAAERVAATVTQGVHGRRRVGQGETFWQFRDYEPGDTPNLIDWRQSAKSDRVFVRQLEWEAAQSVWIWMDRSPSMDWRSDRRLPEKRARAELILLALIVLLLSGGERVGVIGATRRAMSGRGALEALARALCASAAPRTGVPAASEPPRHARVLLAGDFLVPLDELEARVRAFAERRVSGNLLQILDPAEETLPYKGRVRFEGLEGEDPWLLSRTETIRERYHQRLHRHRDGLRAIARAAGWRYDLHHTDQSVESALLTLYMGMARNLEA